MVRADWWCEVWLLENGVADVETIDRSFRNDIGFWATIAGPFMPLPVVVVSNAPARTLLHGFDARKRQLERAEQIGRVGDEGEAPEEVARATRGPAREGLAPPWLHPGRGAPGDRQRPLPARCPGTQVPGRPQGMALAIRIPLFAAIDRSPFQCPSPVAGRGGWGVRFGAPLSHAWGRGWGGG